MTFARQFTRRAAPVLLAALASAAAAQDKYPSKPVTVIVPQAPGGANDAIARIVAQKLTEQTGQQDLAIFPGHGLDSVSYRIHVPAARQDASFIASSGPTRCGQRELGRETSRSNCRYCPYDDMMPT